MQTMQARARMGRPLIQWRAVFGGMILGIGTMTLLTSLLLALGFGSEMTNVRANMEWLLSGSAIFSMLMGGYLAGWLSGIRGAASGIVNGSSVWALVLLATLAVGIPASITRITEEQLTMLSTDATWVTFWSMLIGLGAAVFGGLLGGLRPRADMAEAHHHMEVEDESGRLDDETEERRIAS